MKKPPGDKQRLQHIHDSISYILTFTIGLDEAGYVSNVLVQSAVERQLEIIGEAVAAVSDDLKAKHPEIEWHKIKAFRNVIAHEYFGISQKQVWNVVAYDIPRLKSSLFEVLNSLE